LAPAATGRRALFAYAAQLFIVAFFNSDVMARSSRRENALFQAAAVALVWLLCVAYPRVEESLKRLTARPAVLATPSA